MVDFFGELFLLEAFLPEVVFDVICDGDYY